MLVLWGRHRHVSWALFNGLSTEFEHGVWEAKILSRHIRILVLSRLSREKRNAVLGFFSFDKDKVKFVLDTYIWQR